MYCSKCLKQITDITENCPFCKELLPYDEKEAINPQMVLRPVFKTWTAIVYIIPFQFMIIHFLVMFWVFYYFFTYLDENSVDISGELTYIFAFLSYLLAFVFPIVLYQLQKKSTKKTEYRFYKDKLIYRSGFFNNKEKSIDYCRFSRIIVLKTFTQNRYNLGSLHLKIENSKGIRIKYIPQPDKISEILKKIIGV